MGRGRGSESEVIRFNRVREYVVFGQKEYIHAEILYSSSAQGAVNMKQYLPTNTLRRKGLWDTQGFFFPPFCLVVHLKY